MQEIKCKPEQFPPEEFEEAGFHVDAHGFTQWNGVAIASREPLDRHRNAFPGMPGFAKGHSGLMLPQEARAIGATVGGVRVWSLYVPNGRALEDPHYYYKLEWLSALRSTPASTLAAPPTSPSPSWATSTSRRRMPTTATPRSSRASPPTSSQPERAAFHALEEAGLHGRRAPLVPTGYTYWDYKRLRFPKNEGMRIDFILGSKAFADAVTGAAIHRNERKGEVPSDHVPVVVDLAIESPERMTKTAR